MPRSHSIGEPFSGSKVFLQGDAIAGYFRGMMEGVIAYAHQLPRPWQLRWERQLFPLPRLLGEGFEAALVTDANQDEVWALQEAGLPVVRMSSVSSLADITRVTVDNVQIGQMAAEHFRQRLYRSFAYIGSVRHRFMAQRRQGFQEGLGGVEIPTLECDLACVDLSHPLEALPRFIARLPRHTAIFCANDDFGLETVRVATFLSRKVPSDLAVLSVDNDPLLVHSSPVLLSSIDPDFPEVGKRAAKRLQQQMASEIQNGGAELVPPKGLITRESSDYLATDDDLVQQTVKTIRRLAAGGVSVEDLCRQLGVGRRTLERRFRLVLGRGLAEELRAVRIQKAAQLLAQTLLPVETISEQTGFSDRFHFSTAFRKAMGLSPLAWRTANSRR